MLQFLHDKHTEGKSPSSVGVYKAALSNTLKPIEGYQIGSHPHVLTFFKGMCNSRPRKYKKLPRWKVQDVLNTLTSWGPNNELTRKQLTYKTTMLLALTSGARCSELAALDTTRLHHHHGIGIEFELTNHKKTKRSNVLPGKLSIPTFGDVNPIICPVATLEQYLLKTDRLGHLFYCQGEEITTPADTADPLLRRLVAPFTKVTPKTISRWLTAVIAESTENISSDHNIGHSTRSKAATEAAFKGLTITDIMKAAEWQSETVFHNHYYQPSFDTRFGRAVLGENALGS